jgi:hypothetical protein
LKPARLAAVSALVFLGLSALAGAIPMLLHPAGGSSFLPPSLLEHSPFRSYLIPGLLLLVANGLLSFQVLWLTILNRPGYALWIGAQGCVLAGWLMAEIWLLRVVSWLHFVYGAIAMVLIISGVLLRRDQGPAAESSSSAQDFVI